MHSVPSAVFVSPHTPVAVSQRFFLHVVSPVLSHVTTVVRSTLQVLFTHFCRPLHLFPSSRQSPSTTQQPAAAVPPVHTPSWHVSPTVQALPSLHAPALRLLNTQVPVAASQVSVVHSLLSSHVMFWQPPVIGTPNVFTGLKIDAELTSLEPRNGVILMIFVGSPGSWTFSSTVRPIDVPEVTLNSDVLYLPSLAAEPSTPGPRCVAAASFELVSTEASVGLSNVMFARSCEAWISF